MTLFRNKKSLIDDQEISPGRLQALVDGVFAIAMTLLIFNIKLPELPSTANPSQLWMELALLWPGILSFIISFIILGTFWAGHHTEFHYIKKLDHKLIWLNIFYLLFVSFLPFSAALLGKYAQNQVAIIVYGVNLVTMVVIHHVMWQHAAHHKNLVKDNLDPRINTLVDFVAFFAIFAYMLAIFASFWWIPASLFIFAVVPIPYIMGWIYKLV